MGAISASPIIIAAATDTTLNVNRPNKFVYNYTSSDSDAIDDGDGKMYKTNGNNDHIYDEINYPMWKGNENNNKNETKN